MAALKATLVKSMSGHTERHRATLRCLGLTRRGKTRILPDNPAIRGMIAQVGYLLDWSETNEEFKSFGHRASRARKAQA